MAVKASDPNGATVVFSNQQWYSNADDFVAQGWVIEEEDLDADYAHFHPPFAAFRLRGTPGGGPGGTTFSPDISIYVIDGSLTGPRTLAGDEFGLYFRNLGELLLEALNGILISGGTSIEAFAESVTIQGSGNVQFATLPTGKMYIITPFVADSNPATALAGHTLTLLDPLTGEVEFAPASGGGADTNIYNSDGTQTDPVRTYDGDLGRLNFLNLREFRVQTLDDEDLGVSLESTIQVFSGAPAIRLVASDIVQLDTEGAARLCLRTSEVFAATRTIGQVLTLMDDETGESEWQDAPGGGAANNIYLNDGTIVDPIRTVTIPTDTVLVFENTTPQSEPQGTTIIIRQDSDPDFPQRAIVFQDASEVEIGQIVVGQGVFYHSNQEAAFSADGSVYLASNNITVLTLDPNGTVIIGPLFADPATPFSGALWYNFPGVFHGASNRLRFQAGFDPADTKTIAYIEDDLTGASELVAAPTYTVSGNTYSVIFDASLQSITATLGGDMLEGRDYLFACWNNDTASGNSITFQAASGFDLAVDAVQSFPAPALVCNAGGAGLSGPWRTLLVRRVGTGIFIK